MKRSVLFLCLLATLAGVAPVWSQHVDAGPLESYLRKLRAGFESMGHKSFQQKFPDGKTKELFTVEATRRSYTKFDAHGMKLQEWSIKSDGQIAYEAWYAPQRTKERLLEDDRSISYTSFRENGQKWEQYTYNKLKHLKAYDVYDKNGRLMK